MWLFRVELDQCIAYQRLGMCCSRSWVLFRFLGSLSLAPRLHLCFLCNILALEMYLAVMVSTGCFIFILPILQELKGTHSYHLHLSLLCEIGTLERWWVAQHSIGTRDLVSLDPIQSFAYYATLSLCNTLNKKQMLPLTSVARYLQGVCPRTDSPTDTKHPLYFSAVTIAKKCLVASPF